MFNRRTFLKSSAAVLPATAAINILPTLSADEVAVSTVGASTTRLVPLPPRQPSIDPATEPWQKKVRRVGQSNMTEHDPAVMNIEAWADYWHSAKADIVFISVTGILAFYPSKVKFHRHGKFLHGRDFFGECVAAAKKRNMRVVARMSPDLNWGDALEAHPEWAMRNQDGSVQFSDEEPRLFKTCMFTSYMDDYVPAIMREINSLYDVDCFYTNGWPPIGSLPECYCAICSKLPAPAPRPSGRRSTTAFSISGRSTTPLPKRKNRTASSSQTSGGNVRGGPNLNRLGKIAAWFQADNQGRTYDDSAVWGCSLQGRVCNAVLDGKFAANVTAAYSTGAITWRNASKNPAEAEMWLNETLASGMVPYYHFIGSETGFGEDRRWQKVGADYFRWSAKHDVASHHSPFHCEYRSCHRSKHPASISRSREHALTRLHARNHERHLRRAASGSFRLRLRTRRPPRSGTPRQVPCALLPNIAMLSDRQCQQIREYVQSGGSIMASFETGLYDENLKPRD